ncbi:MAG TPA: ComEC/Rec2 family competence protein [Candidatus Acidoferrales bacterium]|nr:ComEC/Rec2 family competence protein [Candidatus Acidoferrales bacterium]
MKAPFLTVAASICAGIVLARLQPEPVSAWCVAAGSILTLAAVLISLNLRLGALIAASAAWLALGGLSAAISDSRTAPNLVSALAASHKIDLGISMRWRGWLRSDPARLPYGWRFEIDLESIELRSEVVPVTGGMRATYYQSLPALPEAMRAGDEVQFIARAEIPRNYGDPGAVDYRAQLAREGIDATASLRSLALIRATGHSRSSVRVWLARARGGLLDEINELFAGQPREAAVLRAMLLGDRTFIDTETADDFQRTSSFHVLVVAGLHVASLAGFVFWIARRARLSKLAASSSALLLLIAYMGIVQDRPPILRATLMAAVYLLVAPLYRRLEPLQSVAIAAAGILLFRPAELFDPSFQFSFLAVTAIAAIGVPRLARTAEPLRRALGHVSDATRDPSFAPRLVQLRLDLRALAAKLSRSAPGHASERATRFAALPLRIGVTAFEVFAISAVIQLGLLPLSVAQYHRVSSIGIIANVGALVFTSLVVPLGFITLSVGLISRAAARIFAGALHVFVSAMLVAVHFFAGPSWSSQRVPDVPRWLVLIYLALLLVLALSIRRSGRALGRVSFAIVVSAAAAIVIHPLAPSLHTGELETTVLDVGQGDSIFLATPAGRTMLVDGGGTPGAFRIGGMRTRFDVGEEVVSRFLWSRGLKALDAIALTHAHEDHLEGLSAVIDNFRVGELWVGHDVASAEYRNLIERAKRRSVKIVQLRQGDRIAFGGAEIDVLWPDSDARVPEPQNDDSLVLRVSYGEDAVLLAGDVEHGVEAQLAQEDRPLSADFLKVAHHGSKTSSTPEFLSRVQPSFAAISVGENNAFGHPSEITLEHLQDAHAQVLRTDFDGAITYLTDGSKAQISAYRSREIRPHRFSEPLAEHFIELFLGSPR